MNQYPETRRKYDIGWQVKAPIVFRYLSQLHVYTEASINAACTVPHRHKSRRDWFCVLPTLYTHDLSSCKPTLFTCDCAISRFIEFVELSSQSHYLHPRLVVRVDCIGDLIRCLHSSGCKPCRVANESCCWRRSMQPINVTS